jgi:hypothetical protein
MDMLAKNVSLDTLSQAASDVGVRLSPDARDTNRGVRFTLALALDKKYQRTSTNMFFRGRRVNAVCFHGHEAFFRRLYALAPDADITSGMARFRSVGDLNEQADGIGDRDVGPMASPIAYRDCCECEVGA